MPSEPIDRRGARETIRAALLDRLPAVGDFLVDGIRRRSTDETGELDASYEYEIDEAGDRLLVGTELRKGLFREIGTRRMKPGAAIRRTLAEEGAKLPEILNGDR